MFEWTGSEELTQINIAEHLSPFVVHKTDFDIQEMIKMQAILAKNPDITTKELRQLLEYPNTMLRLLLGYKDQVTGIGRNTFLLN